MKVGMLLLACILAVFSFSCSDSGGNKDEKLKNVPEWSQNAIWYQIFVERFRNGDSKNDPTLEYMQGTYPDSLPANWAVTPWGHDWFAPDAWFMDSTVLPNKWDNLQARRYGGDLQGVLDKLDYLKDLGITVIYFNPLNDSPSLHKYDPRFWHHIDRNFGPDPAKDTEMLRTENHADPKKWVWTTADSLFLKVIDECHKRDIKVVVDFSWNHVGSEFWAFNDIKKNGKSSVFADWFEVEEYDNPATPENEFKYVGWANVKYMPEANKVIEGGVRNYPVEGNYYSNDLKYHIFAVTHRWMDPNRDGTFNDGIDGIRLDVAAEVPLGFWRDYRKFVRKTNPEFYLVGEVWWKSWPDTLMNPEKFVQGDIFDAIMHYRWFKPTRHYFASAPNKRTASNYKAGLDSLFVGIDSANMRAMMNLTSSHDAPRLLSSVYNKFKYKYNEKATADAGFKIDRPDELTYKIVKMIIAQQFTFVGSPHIWNGEEAGMWGGDDPDNRKPIVWDDISYEMETHHPLGINRTADSVKVNEELFSFYKNMIKLRKENPVLAFGHLDYVLVDDARNLLAYRRFDARNEIVVVFNNSDVSQQVVISATKGTMYKDLFNKNNNQNVDLKNGFDLEAKSFIILKMK